jgi:hypothetical protein
MLQLVSYPFVPCQDLQLIGYASDVLEGFPEAVQSLVGGKCKSIETTFDVGPMIWSFETEYRKYGHMNAAKFEEFAWSSGTYIEPASPLPNFRDLVAEDILPQYWAQSAIRKLPICSREPLSVSWMDPEVDENEVNDVNSQAVDREESRERDEPAHDGAGGAQDVSDADGCPSEDDDDVEKKVRVEKEEGEEEMVTGGVHANSNDAIVEFSSRGNDKEE